MLGVRKIHTSYHPMSNGILERWHRSSHTGSSHYINALHTNWDVVVPFYFMAYRATPIQSILFVTRKRDASPKQ